jgi:hypothetical protein
MAMIRASFGNFDIARIRKRQTQTHINHPLKQVPLSYFLLQLFVTMAAISELTQNDTGRLF